MRISVVIPAYNASETLPACLNALSAQTRASDEVIVVDSSSDSTPAVVRARFPGVRLVHLAERTLPGRARNLGIEESTGDLVVFTDADCVPRPDWLATIEAAFTARPDLAGCGGASENANPATRVSRLSFLLDFNDILPAFPAGERRTHPSLNLAWRRSVLQRYGGFPETFFPGEDIVHAFRLTAAGETLTFVPDAVVGHVNTEDWARVLQRQYARGQGFVAARRSCPEMPGNRVLNSRLLARSTPIIRFARIAARLAGRAPAGAAAFLAATPAVMQALIHWRRGLLAALASPAESPGA